MPNIGKMQLTGIADIDSPKFHAQKFRKHHRIVLGTPRGPKPGHRERKNFVGRALQQLECFRDNEQSQSRIEAA